MAKINIKSEKITPFGGIFHVRNMFSRYAQFQLASAKLRNHFEKLMFWSFEI